MDADAPLGPPGAGLPTAELLFVRCAFALARGVMTPENALARFERETERIATLAQSLPLELAQRQVVIPRVMGIEDSSRNWSVLMTVGHLNITTAFIQAIVERLRNEEAIDREVRIQDVKPSVEQSETTVKLFRRICGRYVKSVAALGKLNSKTTHTHPWFGPLNAHGWHCLAAIHHTIHRRQIEAIIRELKAAQ
ncbi:MAG TPA: DinB family protein [Methylomirabilota bacterium]|nr:DinB family protein [Methylomirabilota bacterium]